MLQDVNLKMFAWCRLHIKKWEMGHTLTLPAILQFCHMPRATVVAYPSSYLYWDNIVSSVVFRELV